MRNPENRSATGVAGTVPLNPVDRVRAGIRTHAAERSPYTVLGCGLPRGPRLTVARSARRFRYEISQYNNIRNCFSGTVSRFHAMLQSEANLTERTIFHGR